MRAVRSRVRIVKRKRRAEPRPWRGNWMFRALKVMVVGVIFGNEG